MEIPWKTLCGSALTAYAMYLGYNSQIALVAVGVLFGVELYGQKKKQTEEGKTSVLEEA